MLSCSKCAASIGCATCLSCPNIVGIEYSTADDDNILEEPKESIPVPLPQITSPTPVTSPVPQVITPSPITSEAKPLSTDSDASDSKKKEKKEKKDKKKKDKKKKEEEQTEENSEEIGEIPVEASEVTDLPEETTGEVEEEEVDPELTERAKAMAKMLSGLME